MPFENRYNSEALVFLELYLWTLEIIEPIFYEHFLDRYKSEIHL